MHSFTIHTLGCKVNQYESQALREQFLSTGYTEVNDHAAVVVINTCTVTGKSDSKSRQVIHRAVRENPGAAIIVTGCYAEASSHSLTEIAGITHIIGNSYKDRILSVLGEYRQENDIVVKVGGIGHTGFPDLHITKFSGHTRAFLKIQDGCSLRCTYCKIPDVRGPSRSRDRHEVITEARCLVENGYKEIVLSGINLGCYGLPDYPDALVSLIQTLATREGLVRLRMSSIEPIYISDRLIDTIAHCPIVCRHLHIPLQSGDDRILKLMGRRYTASDYRSLVHRIRERIPEIALTTDIMIGFPGEGEREFNNTLSLIQQLLFNKVHLFTYSTRADTGASRYADEVSPQELSRRYDAARVATEKTALLFKKKFLGTVVPVLVEGSCRNRKDFLYGFTDTYTKVSFPRPHEETQNTLRDILIKDCTPYECYGELVSNDHRQ